ncbi:MAG TPA: O-antigen ligase family protein [Cellvibrio sp.]|nr:O-antigen ligase family protein [Cellvibrio sp.]
MFFNKFAIAKIPVLLISIFVFLFGTLAFIVPSGYTYGPLLLVLFALGYLFVRPYPQLISADKYVITALLVYFLVSAVTNVAHHLSSRHYDNASRFLFAIPVLLLLLRFPINAIFLWAGIAFGAFGAGFVALMDFYVHGELRAGGYNNPIQFGDIAMLFACLLMAGFAWAKQRSRSMIVIFLLGIVSGILASVLSGARGGWLALPFGLVAFYLANDVHKNTKKTALFIVAILCAAGFAHYFLSQDVLQARVQDAISDLQQYFQANNANTSLGARLTLWQASLPLIAEHPVLGWGSVANYVSLSGDSADVFQRFNHFHNDILDALVKRGLLGGLALLVIYVLPAVLFYRQLKQCSPTKKPFACAGLILVITTFVFGLTQSFFSHSSGVMIYVFMLVILWAQVRSPDVNPNRDLQANNK